MKDLVIITPDELSDIIKTAMRDVLVESKPEKPVKPTDRKTLYSIRELSEFLGCSQPTAHRFKKNGLIPCHQIGRKILFYTDEVLKAMEQKKRK